MTRPSAARPSLLDVLEATINADPNPPGFCGRLAVAECYPDRTNWLLLSFAQDLLHTSRSEERLAASGFDCIVLANTADGGGLPESPARPVVDGDPAVLARFTSRYLETRSRLGLQLQALQSSATSRRPARRRKP